ncbi:hypothetical protein M0805_006018 [Coniferiporia weirii]|nr:hypothetical protein M0805_006018 [Coniferiporia weirii]
MSTSDSDVLPPFRKWPEGAEIKTFTGGCHCRKFTYEVEHPALEERQPVSCNCSICTQKGELLVYSPEARFHFTTGSFDETSKYAWGGKNVVRHFCPTCGCALLFTGFGLAGVNARSFDGIQIDRLNPTFFDAVCGPSAQSFASQSLLKPTLSADDSDVFPHLRKWPEGTEIKTFVGGCHCRKFRFELEHPALDVRQPVSCNCSICTQNAQLFVYAPESRFRFTHGSFEETSGYAWGLKSAVRHFCPNCGCSLLFRGLGLAGVNVRTFDGIEIDKLNLTYFDGARLL